MTTNHRKTRGFALATGLALLPLVVLYILAATDDGENIVLVRNEVSTFADGETRWNGTMMNWTDSVYRDIDVTIRFLDGQDRALGETFGSVARLAPREQLALEAPLPTGAEQVQIYSLHWKTGSVERDLGPYAAWPFGYVQYQ